MFNFIHRLSTSIKPSSRFPSFLLRALLLLLNWQPLLVPKTDYHFDRSVITITMAADQLQHTGTKTVVDPEPLTGLNMISDTTVNSHISGDPIALAEVDHNLVSDMNSNASVDTKPKSKKVSVAEPNKAFSDVDENLEIAVPEREENEDRLNDEIDGTNMQMEISGKKRNKNKKKPKSQRGLVQTHSIIKESPC